MAEYRPLGELVDRRGRWVLLTSLLLAHFMAGLNQFLVATATPQMLVDLGGFDLLPWVFTTYVLAATVAAPIVGKLSDLYGRRNLLVAAILLFLAGTLGCGFAPSMPALIAARAFQGVGGGMILACVIATLADLFAPAERGRYFGIFIGAQTIAGLSGPSIGGALTDLLSWRWVFFLNTPLALVALGFIWLNLPAGGTRGSLRNIDFAGAGLLATATITFLLALTWSHEAYGWTAPQTLALVLASAVALVAFLVQERGNPDAILPLPIFRTREFAIASGAAVLLSAGMQGTVQYLPTFVQTALGSSATVSGLISTPQALAMFLASVIGGYLLGKVGRYRWQCVAGSLLAATGTFLLSGVDVGEPGWRIAMFMFVLGFGGGLVTPTLSIVSQNALPQELVGVASGARMFFMQIGTVLGVALFGALLASSYQGAFADNLPAEATASVPAPLLAEFDDPTLPLNETRFAEIQAEMRALPGGEALVTSLVSVQAHAVTTATQDMFLGATLVLVTAAVVLAALKDVPLRRTLSAPTGTSASSPAPSARTGEAREAPGLTPATGDVGPPQT